MEKAGFTIDNEYDVYAKEGYGALKTNVDFDIKTANVLEIYYETHLKKYIYKELAKEINREEKGRCKKKGTK